MIEDEQSQMAHFSYRLLTIIKYGDKLSFSSIAVVARCKVWACGRSIAGIVGLDSAGDMDVCLL
jgi:hypothetical protein